MSGTRHPESSVDRQDWFVVELDRLAERARIGDRDALGQLIHGVQTDVWHFCAHMSDRADADDLTQETLLRVIQRLGRWERGGVKTWILGIAYNVCREHHRRNQRQPQLPGSMPAAPVSDRHGAVELADLLARLPIDQREAFTLTQVVGFSYAETAEVVGCPIGTVRSRVARAREALAEMLTDDRGANRRTGELA